MKKITNIFQRELNLNHEDTEVVKYSLSVYLTTVIGYLAILFVAWPLGVIKTAVVSAVTASMVRVFSGGAHASKSRNCILFGAAVFPALGLVAHYVSLSLNALIIMVILSWLFVMAVIYLFAPADTPGKPLNTKKQRQQLRRASFTVLVCWVVAALLVLTDVWSVSSEILFASALGLVWQGFSLTPPGYGLVAHIDRFI